MALVDISDTFLNIPKDIQLTTSQKHRAYNLLKYDFPAYDGVGLNIEKMIYDGIPAADIEKIITDYYDDFAINYEKISTIVDENKGNAHIVVQFKGGSRIELNFTKL